MELFERVIPLQGGKNSVARISRALRYEKRLQGFGFRKSVKTVTKPSKRKAFRMRQILNYKP
jgi:hypothetical protein